MDVEHLPKEHRFLRVKELPDVFKNETGRLLYANLDLALSNAQPNAIEFVKTWREYGWMRRPTELNAKQNAATEAAATRKAVLEFVEAVRHFDAIFSPDNGKELQ